MNKTKTASMAVLALAAAGTLLGGSGVQAQTLAGKSDRFLIEQAAKHPQHGWTHVIVRFAGTPTSAQKAQLKALKAGIYRNLEFIHSAALAVPARNLAALAALPFVQRISADLDVKKSDEFIVESSGAAMAAKQYGVTSAVSACFVSDFVIGYAGRFGAKAVPVYLAALQRDNCAKFAVFGLAALGSEALPALARLEADPATSNTVRRRVALIRQWIRETPVRR